MAKFPLYQWKKAGEGSSSIDTQNFASKIKANTFTQKNTFKNTGDILTVQRTDNQSFGIDFKDENNERLAFIGTSQNEVGKATVWGVNGLKLQTTNSDIKMISGTADFQWESNRNWNQNVDNTIVRTKDTKWERIVEKTSGITQPTNNWNWNSWVWTVNNLTATNGVLEIMIGLFFPSSNFLSFNTNIIWKNDLRISKSQIFNLEYSGRTYSFQLEISSNTIKIFHKHDNVSTGGNINSIRIWVKRGINLPGKINNLW